MADNLSLIKMMYQELLESAFYAGLTCRSLEILSDNLIRLEINCEQSNCDDDLFLNSISALKFEVFEMQERNRKSLGFLKDFVDGRKSRFSAQEIKNLKDKFLKD